MMSDRETLAHAVVILSGKGWGQQRIANELGIGRKRVRTILSRVATNREKGHSVLPAKPTRRTRALDAFASAIQELVDRHPDISAVRLHEEMKKKGFEGGYTSVKECLREMRPRPKTPFVERFETEPGAQGQQDWSPYTVPFSEGGPERVKCFSLILSFSRRQFIHFGLKEDLLTLKRQHVAAGARFGGLPHEILYDNQKAVVLRREVGRPIYNPKFLSFAAHYGFTPRALPPRKPQWKGKVEAPFQYVEGNCLNARTPRNLTELNELAESWMNETSDLHIHDTTRERPLDRFQREKDHLLPLPAHPYDTAEVGYRVVNDSALVAWDDILYSVPVTALLDLVVVRATEHEIFVYNHDLSPIATHERAPRGHRDPVIDPKHRPAKRDRHDIDALAAKLGGFGDEGAQFAAGVVRTHRHRGPHLAEVLALLERYNADDVRRALRRAVDYRAFEANTVTRILAATAEPRQLPSTEDARALRRLQEHGAALAIEPRALAVYADAFDGSDNPDEES